MEQLRYGDATVCNFMNDDGDVVYGECPAEVYEPDYELLAEEQADYELQRVLAGLQPEGAKTVAVLQQRIANAAPQIETYEAHGMKHARHRLHERLGYSLAATAYIALLRGAFTDEQFAAVHAAFVKPYQADKRFTPSYIPYDDVKCRAANDKG